MKLSKLWNIASKATGRTASDNRCENMTQLSFFWFYCANEPSAQPQNTRKVPLFIISFRVIFTIFACYSGRLAFRAQLPNAFSAFEQLFLFQVRGICLNVVVRCKSLQLFHHLICFSFVAFQRKIFCVSFWRHTFDVVQKKTSKMCIFALLVPIATTKTVRQQL